MAEQQTRDDDGKEVAALTDAVGHIKKRVDAMKRRNDGDAKLSELIGMLRTLTKQLARLAPDDGEGGEGEDTEADDDRRRDQTNNAEPSGDRRVGLRDDDRRTAQDKENALGEAQQRADSVCMAHGKRAPAPVWGEGVHRYRLRMANNLKEFSPAYAQADLSLIRDPHAFGEAEKVIYEDAVKAARSGETVACGKLRKVSELDQAGRKITRFYGGRGPGSPLVNNSPYVALAPFMRPALRVKAIHTEMPKTWTF